MAINEFNQASKELVLDTRGGVSGRLTSAVNTLRDLDICIDKVFLDIVAQTISVDPLGVCRAIRGGLLNEVIAPELLEQMSVAGILLYVPWGDPQNPDLILQISLVTNNVGAVRRLVGPTPEEDTFEEVMLVGSARELQQIIKESEDLAAELVVWFMTFADKARQAPTVADAAHQRATDEVNH